MLLVFDGGREKPCRFSGLYPTVFLHFLSYLLLGLAYFKVLIGFKSAKWESKECIEKSIFLKKKNFVLNGCVGKKKTPFLGEGCNIGTSVASWGFPRMTKWTCEVLMWRLWHCRLYIKDTELCCSIMSHVLSLDIFDAHPPAILCLLNKFILLLNSHTRSLILRNFCFLDQKKWC